jgi:amino acid adenylation domain-containing protein
MAAIDLKGMSSPDRRELLRALLADRQSASDGRGGEPQLQPDLPARGAPFPLTAIQQAYWVGREHAFCLGGVGIHGYFELECVDLDLPRLQRAWNATVRRHDMMRTVVRPDGCAQIIEAPPDYVIEPHDMRGNSLDEQEQRRAQIRARMSHQVFDVTRWPLFELLAVRLDERTTRLHYSEDAIHLDMASSAIVIADWLRLYRDPQVQLPRLALSYRDYALALQRQAGTPGYACALAYWRARLPALPDPPSLPLATGLNAVRMQFARRKLILEPRRWQLLQARAADAGLTPSDALLAAYVEVLGCWSAERRFILNVTVQNRLPLHPQVAEITGDFTSFTLLEVDAGGSDGFVARARRYRNQLWQDLENREVSGVTVLRELAQQRGDAGYVVPYVFTSALSTSGYRGIDALGEIVYEVTQTPQVLLDQQALECGGALVLSWDVVESAFQPGVIDAMFEALRGRLDALCHDQDAWLNGGALPLPESQWRRRQRLNDTDVPFERERLEALFAKRVAERAHQPAIFDAAGVMTYAELDDASWRLCAALSHARGGANEAPVAIAVEKGRGQVVAALGILKAGAAYLPLDLAQPPARIARMLQASGCTRVVVDTDSCGLQLPEGLETVALPSAQSGAVMGRQGPLRGDPQQAAYVLFTSGSTGEPKGAIVSHDAVVNRMLDVVARFALGAQDRAFAITALHHDLSVFDIFGMLAVAGGAIVMPRAEILAEPARWMEYVREHAVTVWNSVPAFLEMLLAYAEAQPDGSTCAASLPSLSLILVAGDFIPPSLPERLRRIAPGARFIALGGPTETTVWDICHPFEGMPPSWSTIPYGRPMANARYYVLREDLSECPDWVPGELCIGGVGVAAGYAGDPLLSAQRFIVHPATQERLYRSGDRGRMRPDGLIEILGRLDRQVKLDGHRIELGEVEAALRRHPQVSNAAACLSNDAAAKRLIAFVTAAAAESVRAGEIRLDSHAAPLTLARARRSARGFAQQTVPFASFAALLSCFGESQQPDAVARRRYPSAGALYAVDLFVSVVDGKIGEVPGGLYRFDARSRALTRCSQELRLDPGAHAPWNESLAQQSAFTLFLIADIAALAGRYGEHARDLCLVESGYMGQLAVCAAGELGVALCPIGGLDFEGCRAAFPIAQGAQLAHCLVGGMPCIDVDESARPTPVARQFSQRLAGSTLREFLRDQIPSHMIPAQIFVVDALPLTSNGKVDRARLQSSPGTVAPVARASAPKAIELRGEIAAMLAQLLDCERVPMMQAFQEIGVTSVHVVQLHARLCAAGHKLDKTDVFRYPTVESLARFLAGEIAPAGDDAGRAQQRRDLRRQAAARAREVRNAD